MAELEKTCFVIHPFGALGSDVRKHCGQFLNYIVKPACEGLYKVKSAIEDSRPGLITPRVIIDIKEADIIVADLSFGNANVFYELGIAHTMNKSVFHVINSANDIPFDNNDYRTIICDYFDVVDHERAIKELRGQFVSLGEDSTVALNPVSAALGIQGASGEALGVREIVLNMSDEMSLLKRKVDLIDSILTQVDTLSGDSLSNILIKNERKYRENYNNINIIPRRSLISEAYRSSKNLPKSK